MLHRQSVLPALGQLLLLILKRQVSRRPHLKGRWTPSVDQISPGCQEAIDMIADLFAGEVPVPLIPVPMAWVVDISGVLQNPCALRQTLPLFPSLLKALTEIESEISAVDKPLPVGKYPSVMQLPAAVKEALDLADAPRFLLAAPRDSSSSYGVGSHCYFFRQPPQTGCSAGTVWGDGFQRSAGKSHQQSFRPSTVRSF